MRVPLSWLRDYVDLTLPTPALAERLTLAGLAVDAIERVGDWWDPAFVRVAEVVSVLPHPDADRLTLVDVDDGSGQTEQVVTGAPNLFAFKGRTKADGTLPVLKAPFARSGASLLDAYSDERPRPFKKLKPSKIRGVLSNGMVCSERELGLSEEHEGILLLPEDAPVGTPLRDYLGDEIFELDLTPDLARALSVAGVAREVAALTGGALHLPPIVAATARATEPAGPAILPSADGKPLVAVEIAEPQRCNRYTAMLVEGVQVGPSPAWMRDRLTRAGMRSISNVVDITNYVMLALGQPLHAFDYDVLVARAQRVGQATPTIRVRRAQAGEKFTTLDGVARTLSDDMLMITDDAGSVALAGVMGGLESEISDATRNILLESATFDAANTRRTVQALKLNSEASYRFIRGVPATLNAVAARYAAELLSTYAGGRIVAGPAGDVADAYPLPQAAPVVYTTATDMQRLLGLPVSLDEVAAALRRLEFEVEQVEAPAAGAPATATFGLARAPGEPLLACTPPWFRLDISIPADLTEEVARAIGYERVGMTLLSDELPPQRRNETYETEERIRNLLTAAGLQETVNYALTSPESSARLTPGTPAAESDFLSLANAIAPERRSLRRSLLVSALENLARNVRLAPRHATFEVGRVYMPEAGDGTLPHEDRRVSLLLAGLRTPPDFYTPDGGDEVDFYDMKGVVEVLLERLGFAPAQIEFVPAPDVAPFGPRCAAVQIDGTPIGHLGELHPRVRQAFDLPAMRVALAELRVEPLVRPHFQLTPMRPISPYPAVIEDLAFELEEEVTVRRVEKTIRAAGGFLLTEVALFDIFRGGTVAAGRKSLAFHLTYQSPDRPLTEREVASLRRRVIDAVVKETGATLRS